MMDDFEKRVLRLKKSVMAQALPLNDEEFLRSVRRTNLITDDVVQTVLAKEDADHKASVFVDHVMTAAVSNAFDVLTNFLMTDFSWLVKELQADLRAERGNLEIDEDVMKEAGMLVHRKFGTSKRISEQDKREIQELIAVKIQISKEEWKEEFGVLQKEIHRLESVAESEDQKAKDIDTAVEKFVSKYESKLMSRAHGMKSTTETLKTSINDTDTLAILRARVLNVLARTRLVMEERDLLFEDREKCFELLVGNASGNGEHSVADVIKRQAQKDPGPEKKLREELEQKEQAIIRLRKLTAEYETELDGNEDKVKGIKDDLEARTKENLDLKSQVKQLEQELQAMKIKSSEAAKSRSNKKR